MNTDLILSQIENDLLSDNSNLKEWNSNYFKHQKERYTKDINFYANLKDVKNVLEIGAAPFHMSVCLKELGFNLKILDLEPKRFDWFIQKHQLDVFNVNVETDEIPVNDASQDLIILTEVFEHLRINPIQTLNKIYSKIKPGGYFYLTTPNFYNYGNTVMFLKGKSVVNAFYEFQKLETIGHMGHVREYSKKEMFLFLENAGFKIEKFEFKNARKPKRFSQTHIATTLFNHKKSHMMFLCKK